MGLAPNRLNDLARSWEGEAPAEPKEMRDFPPLPRLGRSLALPTLRKPI